jgi:hypothetical protein
MWRDNIILSRQGHWRDQNGQMCKKIKNDYKILNKKGLKKKISCLI